MNKLRQSARLFLVMMTTGLLSGCATVGEAHLIGGSDSDARDRILNVAGNPPSLGYQRLQYHSIACPAVKKFLEIRGYPNFIIEDTKLTSRTIVIYYVKPNQAYLLGITTGLAPQKFDVSGPEPIGKQTRALFDALDKLERAEAGDARADARADAPTKKAGH